MAEEDNELMSYECHMNDIVLMLMPRRFLALHGNSDYGAFFYFTEIGETECIGISCPPNGAGMEVSCVVCTK